MNAKRAMLLTSPAFLGLTLVSMWLIFLSGPPRVSRAASFTVCPDGPPTCDYGSIQEAVDAAGDGDVIKVAAGTYNDVNNYSGLAQVVYINKTVTIQGGYTTAFSEPPDPAANPTTLDAGGQGRVIFIEGNITPTIEGLRITGGEAKDLGSPIGIDAGGGVMVISATATLKDNYIFENSADSTLNGDGGGVFLYNSDATLDGNTISNNSVQRSGGGVGLLGSKATLKDNIISENTSSAAGGGGLSLEWSDALLSGNTIVSNTANSWWGGGVHIHLSSATLNGNNISANTAPEGGGVIVYDSDNVTFWGNTISDNIANDSGGGMSFHQSNNIVLVGNTIANNQANGYGGAGLKFYLCDQVTIRNNHVIGNSTPGDAGGILPGAGSFSIIGNTIISNTAGGAGGGITVHDSDGEKIITGNTIAGNSSGSEGGGLHLNGNPVLTNNMIVDNQTALGGSGINISAGSPKLFHNTIARNTGGDGRGIYVGSGSVTMTNTILISHTVGIFVEPGCSASIESTLWGNGIWANGLDWDGAGTINHNNDYWGNPDFVDYQASDYHIGSNSDAIDAGVDAGVARDIDGQPRPYQAPDIGADEYWPPGVLKYIYLPLTTR